MVRYQSIRKPWPPHRRFEPRPAVHWLSPSELVDAGVRAVISKIFGDYADRRETFAMLEPHAGEDDPPMEREGFFLEGEPDQSEFWFDYVSDVGDGFSPTYSVAEAIARDGIDVGTEKLCRGQVLVMGGDEVYPTPSAKAYRDRTTGPYEAALQFLVPIDETQDESVTGAAATLYAIPGNHDWYDGLSAFLKQFCSRQWIGAWQTRQHRSYFAIELPQGWWLWGIDIAFDAPIDAAQLDYFREASRRLDPGDSVILATAKPSWKDCDQDADGAVLDEPYHNLNYFVTKTIVEQSQAEVRLMLAGDKHFYARYSELGTTSPARPHKIIAGGGGAYLSSTALLHDCVTVQEPSRTAERPGLATTYALEQAWPSPQVSKALGWKALWRLPQTTRLYAMIGVVVALVGWLVRRAVNETVIARLPVAGPEQLTDQAARSLPISEAARPIARAALDSRFLSDVVDYGPLWLAAALLAVMFVPFAAKGSARGGRPLTWALAVVHSLGYLAAAVVSVAVAARAAVDAPVPASIVLGIVVLIVVWFGSIEAAPLNRPRKVRTPMITTTLVVAVWLVLTAVESGPQWVSELRATGVYVVALVVVGGLLGSLVLALYLIGASALGRNLNELFTAVRSQQYKNFLRMRIDGQGTLDLWALGIKDPGTRSATWDEAGNLRIDGDRPEAANPPKITLIDHIRIIPRG